jgi:hypothetical protein
MTKRDLHLNRHSDLPGHKLIEGRLLLWRAPFHVDLARVSRHSGNAYRWYRVLDCDGIVVGRYSRFGIAYMVMQWCYDECRLRDGYPHACPSKPATQDYLRKVEDAKLQSTVLKAEAYRKRHLMRDSNAARNRRTRAALDMEDLARMPGSFPRRRWGQGRRTRKDRWGEN